MNKIFKVLLFIFGLALTAALIILIVLWLESPGKAEPLKGPGGKTLPGSISAIEKVSLGGLEQYIIIRGADTTKPLMLFLHGGPGNPEFAFMKEANPEIEELFLMVYWEQRGAGKSYSGNISPESMNTEQFISDTRELSEILIQRFGKDRIYIAGHSWGSFLGILAADRYPRLYHAFIGIGQVCHQYRAEKISYEWIKEKAREKNDRQALENISEINVPDSLAGSSEWIEFLREERKYVNRYGGGITRNIKSRWPLALVVAKTKEYSLADKINYPMGALFSLEHLWPEVIQTNLFTRIDSLEVPAYIFQGKYDYQTPWVIAKDFFEQLKAPHKEFYTFSNSAHSPLFEEVEKFNDLLRKEVLMTAPGTGR